jgi:hypothetical protein
MAGGTAPGAAGGVSPGTPAGGRTGGTPCSGMRRRDHDAGRYVGECAARLQPESDLDGGVADVVEDGATHLERGAQPSLPVEPLPRAGGEARTGVGAGQQCTDIPVPCVGGYGLERQPCAHIGGGPLQREEVVAAAEPDTRRAERSFVVARLTVDIGAEVAEPGDHPECRPPHMAEVHLAGDDRRDGGSLGERQADACLDAAERRRRLRVRDSRHTGEECRDEAEGDECDECSAGRRHGTDLTVRG